MPSRVRRMQSEIDALRLEREVEQLRDTNRQLTEALRETTRLLHKLRPCGRQPISGERKLYVAGLQRYRCANPHGTCPLWKCGDGTFGPEGWDVDHKEPWSTCMRNDVASLQALCGICHNLKSRLERMKALDDEACTKPADGKDVADKEGWPD